MATFLVNSYLSRLFVGGDWNVYPGRRIWERGSNGLHQVPKKITNDTTMINIWQSSNKDGLVWLRNVRNPFITSTTLSRFRENTVSGSQDPLAVVRLFLHYFHFVLCACKLIQRNQITYLIFYFGSSFFSKILIKINNEMIKVQDKWNNSNDSATTVQFDMAHISRSSEEYDAGDDDFRGFYRCNSSQWW